MQAIWGQINYFTEESNKNLIKKLKRLIQTPDITVFYLNLINIQLQLDPSTNKNNQFEEEREGGEDVIIEDGEGDEIDEQGKIFILQNP